MLMLWLQGMTDDEEWACPLCQQAAAKQLRKTCLQLASCPTPPYHVFPAAF